MGDNRLGVFICILCPNDKTDKGGCIIKNCLHKFCDRCIVSYIVNDHKGRDSLKCPAVRCRNKISKHEIQKILGDDFDTVACEVLEKKEMMNGTADLQEYFEAKKAHIAEKPQVHKFVKNYQSAFANYRPAERTTTVTGAVLHKQIGTSYQCTADGCDCFTIAHENVNEFECARCKAVNCISCETIHEEKTCKQHQDDMVEKHHLDNVESEKFIQDLLDTKQAMSCPKCGIIVMKDDGCSYIQCAACNLKICWITQKPRYPVTLDDGSIADGCHCKENEGKMCHPDCTNCH